MKGKGATRQAAKKSFLTSANMAGLLKSVSIGVTVISVLVALVLLLLQTVNKPINQLQVNTGLGHITLPMINEQISPWFPDGYLTLDVNAIKDELHSMVMVSQVSVEKIWPDTLKINIEEERPVA
ncbi:MAG: FtsQ-type POTRA domain-containing protein, partial [Bermanella sp.]